jgi:hypothetical protein
MCTTTLTITEKLTHQNRHHPACGFMPKADHNPNAVPKTCCPPSGNCIDSCNPAPLFLNPDPRSDMNPMKIGNMNKGYRKPGKTLRSPRRQRGLGVSSSSSSPAAGTLRFPTSNIARCLAHSLRLCVTGSVHTWASVG